MTDKMYFAAAAGGERGVFDTGDEGGTPVFSTTDLGGPGDDIIEGTNGDDVINGFAGDDVITGARGEDILKWQ